MPLNFKKRFFLYIFFFDLIFSYKGWRFFKNLPVNGQRTWTNAWTANSINAMIKNYKISFYRNILGITNINNINSFILLEYYNLLWKTQWYDEWLELKKLKIIHTSKKKFKKNFVINEENILSELLFIRNKYLKKKVRIQFKSNFDLIGFEPGTLLNYNF